MYLCPNLWWNNPKEIFLLGICFCDLDFSLVCTKKSCFLCALCGNFTTFCLLSPKKTVQNTLWKRQVYNELVNVTMENNRLCKSITNRTLYNVSIQGFPLLSQIYVWTCPVCFAVKKCPLASLIYLSVSTNDPGIKSKIIGVMWQVAPESKTQLFIFNMSP